MCYMGILSTFCDIHGPALISTTSISNEPVENIVVTIIQDLNEDVTKDCLYCCSYKSPSMPCITSLENNICFVSSRNGSGIINRKTLTHISMRCLSCESGDKFTICDNLLLGGTVCYNFSLQDPQARGGKRLFSLAFVALGATSTSILSSNISRMISPALTNVAVELSKGNGFSLIGQDKQKALVCFQVEEFVRFSSASKVDKVPLRKKLDIDCIKLFKRSPIFKPMLTTYLLGKSFVIDIKDCREKEALKDFLEYLSFGKMSSYPIIKSDSEFSVNSETSKNTPTKMIFETKDNTFVISEGQLLNNEELSYADEILKAFHDNLSNEAIQAKLDIVIHNYVSMSKNDFTKRNPCKQLTKIDQEWFQKL